MAKMAEEVLFANLRDKLFTAVVGDVLDKMGWRRQFLPQAVRPLRPDVKIVGRAMPVLEADVFDESSRFPGAAVGKPFGLMLDALDDLRAGEVYIATGGSFRYALWGELMSTRARYLRAAGAVLNGFVRDAAGIEALSDLLPRIVRARPRPARQGDRLSCKRGIRGGADCAWRSHLRRSRGRPCHSR
jgi:4-hydroxy-4-methyl-2-oxoglutarate aldolase